MAQMFASCLSTSCRAFLHNLRGKNRASYVTLVAATAATARRAPSCLRLLPSRGFLRGPQPVAGDVKCVLDELPGFVKIYECKVSRAQYWTHSAARTMYLGFLALIPFVIIQELKERETMYADFEHWNHYTVYKCFGYIAAGMAFLTLGVTVANRMILAIYRNGNEYRAMYRTMLRPKPRLLQYTTEEFSYGGPKDKLLKIKGKHYLVFDDSFV